LYYSWLGIVFTPLLGSLVAGLFRKQVGRCGAHRITITGLGISFVLALNIARIVFLDGIAATQGVLYTWVAGGDLFHFTFNIGYLIDPLSAIMMVTVTFVSLLVHIYSIGYMVDDAGYQRFFSYISLFTFFMLMLVSANDFLQLFFGWEGVGLVSYLLIGFWFTRESAVQGGLKAFLVNRVGDFGFILGIAAVLAYSGSLNYAEVFAHAPKLATSTITLLPGLQCSAVTLICLLLFVGAMGKSAQVPLHIWLPESMEGPTPISALIHAATMVTAGVFMVARMSPLYEHSTVALSVILIIGATGALFTGLIAVVMTDIKRVVAYSTLSQLGYMMVAMGVSAYSAGIFHLVTHACFKAVLFLAAGSVIIAMHHEQDMRKMGGLYKYMPITYGTFLVGSLALSAMPPFSGFFSKDIIIDAARLSTIPAATYAYYCVLLGAFVTGLYSFRALFMTFHGKERMDEKTRAHLKESPWVVWLPLVLLAIPSVFLGYVLIEPILFAKPALLSSALTVLPQHDVLAKIGHHFHGPFQQILDAFTAPTFFLASGGILLAYVAYIVRPELPAFFTQRFAWLYRILMNKYGLDSFNDFVFVRGTRRIGEFFFAVGDRKLIDGVLVNGSAMTVRWAALRGHLVQTGYLYHYATAMVLGLLVFLAWMILL